MFRSEVWPLADDPFPESSSIGGDKEALRFAGFKKLYRLHVARYYTVFYRIFDENDEKVVRTLAITTIEKAHKMYGRFEFRLRGSGTNPIRGIDGMKLFLQNQLVISEIKPSQGHNL